jgi:uncharacterized protein YkwD
MKRGIVLAIFIFIAAGALLAFYEFPKNDSGVSKLIQSANEFFSKGPIVAQVVPSSTAQAIAAPTIITPSPTPFNTAASGPTPSPLPYTSDNAVAGVISKILDNSLFEPSTDPSTSAPRIDINALEKLIHERVNAERAAAGMAPLIWDPMLNQIARGFSKEMATRGFFDHATPEGLGLGDRFMAAGYDSKNGYAENIFMCPEIKSSLYKNGVLVYSEYFSQEEIANLVVIGWIGSQGHRENILNDYLPAEGIGIAISADGNIYITEDFG